MAFEDLHFEEQSDRPAKTKPIRSVSPRLRGKARGQNYRTKLEILVGYAEKRASYLAQHGPVKVLVKDGKPVDQLP